MPGRMIVWATVDLPGFHHWPGAPPHREYLGAPHRHLFRVTACAAVDDEDRETEFHDLADAIRAWWGPGTREWGSASCETLARWLAADLAGRGIPVTETEVSEDGECGATYTLERDDP